MECSLPLLQQLSLKSGRELDYQSDAEDEQVVKARRYCGFFSPSKTAEVEAAETPGAPAWQPSDSSALYNVPGWGSDYFKASDEGHMLVAPQGGEWEPRAAPATARLPVHASRCPPRAAAALASDPAHHSMRRGRPHAGSVRADGAADGRGPARPAALPLPAHRGPPHRQAQRACASCCCC